MCDGNQQGRIIEGDNDLEKCKWLQKQAGNKFVDYLGNGMVMECYGVAGSCVKINNAKSINFDLEFCHGKQKYLVRPN